MEQQQHIVAEDSDRIDHYLAKYNLCTSRAEAIKLIKDGYVLLNNHPVKPSARVREQDLIAINRPPLKTSELKPVHVDFGILHEDKDILVLNKPAGLVVHPGAGNYDTSLVHGLLHHCSDLSGIGGVERPGIVHRLDKGTTGVMVIAKNDKAHQHLSDQFKNKTIKKEYVAIVIGSIDKTDQTLIHLMKRAEMNRKKFVVNQKKGKQAITHVHVERKNSRVSLVRVQIETGRTHQIRVHLSFIGHPIMGDETYGGTKKLKDFDEQEKQFIRDLGHPMLHSHRLSLIHPRTQQTMEFSVEPPEDFKHCMVRFSLE